MSGESGESGECGESGEPDESGESGESSVSSKDAYPLSRQHRPSAPRPALPGDCAGMAGHPRGRLGYTGATFPVAEGAVLALESAHGAAIAKNHKFLWRWVFFDLGNVSLGVYLPPGRPGIWIGPLYIGNIKSGLIC